MNLIDAFLRIQQFKGQDLKQQIHNLQRDLVRMSGSQIPTAIDQRGINRDLLKDAVQVKQASAQIDIVIHTLGILYTLPAILESDETIESLSLGADNASSEFDLVTDRRLGEFKFVIWHEESANAQRKKALFADYYKLARVETSKVRELYLLETEKPGQFLQGKSRIQRVLNRSGLLAEQFTKQYGARYQTVGQFYRDYRDRVRLVNLCQLRPDLVMMLPALRELETGEGH